MTSLQTLLIAGPSGIATFIALLFLIYEGDKRDKRKRARFSGLIAVYGRRARSGAEPRFERVTGKGLSLPGSDRALRVLGARASESHLYPVPWWVLLFIVSISAVVLCSLVARLTSHWAWTAFPAIVVLFARAIFSVYHRRKQKLLYEQIPDALSMIVRVIRAGLPVTEGLRTISNDAPAPTAQEFARVVSDLSLGVPLQDALSTLAKRTNLQEYRFFAVALGVQSQTGGNLTETLENLADVVRKRVALRARATALAAEARLTAYVLVTLPFLTGGALAAVSPEYLLILFHHPNGQSMLLVAAGLLITGIATMRAMIHSSLS